MRKLRPTNKGAHTFGITGFLTWSTLVFPPQLESKTGKGLAERALSDWKTALKREREEHQHLLAESYSAVMDLTKQLQISEKNWNQEKLELLARFKDEQQQAEQQVRELQNKINQVGTERASGILNINPANLALCSPAGVNIDYFYQEQYSLSAINMSVYKCRLIYGCRRIGFDRMLDLSLEPLNPYLALKFTG